MIMLRAQKGKEKTSYRIYKRDLRLILTPGSKKLQRFSGSSFLYSRLITTEYMCLSKTI